MQPSGLEDVRQAKCTGAWDAMNDVDDLLVPDDLGAALTERSPADEHFAAFPPSTRRNILRWIASARTPVTRNKRITATAEEARQNRRVKSNG
ncbi:YdeI/OmpD-associated family protein [Rhodococcoides yunnanense]|uniref:YdeI/OmpD-associated family protein n=1 Tax=Rhodococcoides yunnanense TaxID=278209 RepID=A0ABU4BG99_9NOCA|nr:YdeI/OmpD-associated family protein [Rhodococcus yunnanensis]MDV6263126.1 YdeI/OmpD-associated family protein [Rhodococcus yunnanensis]